MIIFEDDSFYLQAGEAVPFMCPQCHKPIEYADVETVTCPRCSHSGPAAEFMNHRVQLNEQKIQ